MNYKKLCDRVNQIEDRITALAVAGTGMIIGENDMNEASELGAELFELSKGKNELVFSDSGQPNIMVNFDPVPEYQSAALSSDSTLYTPTGYVHPMHIVNGSVRGIQIGKYNCVRVKGVNYGCSLKGLDCAHSIAFDASKTLVEGMGNGFALNTRANWAFLTLLSLRRGFQPRGNTLYGRHHSITSEKGEAASQLDSNRRICRTKTGSGPLTWRTEGSIFGVSDLVGNLYEWLGGGRTYGGKIQVIENNNAIVNGTDQSASSTLWKEIAQDGSFVEPGTEGTLCYDFNSDPTGNDQAFVIAGSVEHHSDYYGGAYFSSIGIRDGVTVPAIAKELLFAPISGNAPAGRSWMRNGANSERLVFAGGFWNSSSIAGLGCLSGDDERSYYYSGIGARPARLKPLY